MRSLFLCAMALVFTVFSGEEAQAKRGGGGGTMEQLSFIAETDITSDAGKPLALCHLTEKRHVLFAGVWRSSIGYALAENNCDADRFYHLDTERFQLGQVLGEFPEDLPLEPKMSAADMISGFWGLGVIVLVLVFAAVKKLKQSKRKAQRRSEMGSIHPAALQAMDAMCHAAKADGRLDASEIAMMADIAKQMTGDTFDEARIRRMFDMAEAKPTDAQFAAFGKGLSAEQKRMVLQATLMIVGADGNLDKQENIFVQKLARGLSISLDEVKLMFQSMAAQPA